MTAPSVREALHGELSDIFERFLAAHDGDRSHLEAVLREWLWDNKAGLVAAFATPPAPTPSAVRERIARIIYPNAGWGVQLDSDYVDLRHEQAKNEERQRQALANADTVIALLPDAAIRAALDQALKSFAEIAASSIPDCPAAYADDDLAWAQRHVAYLRRKAEIARDGIAAAIRAAGEK